MVVVVVEVVVEEVQAGTALQVSGAVGLAGTDWAGRAGRYLYSDRICRLGLAAYQSRDQQIRSALILLSHYLSILHQTSIF